MLLCEMFEGWVYQGRLDESSDVLVFARKKGEITTHRPLSNNAIEQKKRFVSQRTNESGDEKRPAKNPLTLRIQRKNKQLKKDNGNG